MLQNYLDDFINFCENLTCEKIVFCFVIALLAAFCLGFQIGVQTEEELTVKAENLKTTQPDDAYKKDIVYSEQKLVVD